jgi:hypothetical protein
VTQTPMPMRKLLLALAGLMLVPMLAFALFFAWTMRSHGALAEIPVRAALQGVDLLDRGNPATGPLLMREPGGGDLVFLGIPGVGAPIVDADDAPAPTRAWLVLNEHAPDKQIKQRGGFRSYDLSCAYVESLRREVPDMDDYAYARLERICRGVHRA